MSERKKKHLKRFSIKQDMDEYETEMMVFLKGISIINQRRRYYCIYANGLFLQLVVYNVSDKKKGGGYKGLSCIVCNIDKTRSYFFLCNEMMLSCCL